MSELTVEYRSFKYDGTPQHEVTSFDWDKVKQYDLGVDQPGIVVIYLNDGSVAAFPHSSIIRLDTPPT